MNNIEYYKNKENSVLKRILKEENKYNKDYYEENISSYSIKNLIFRLIKGNNTADLDELLKELFENYNFCRDYEFDKYFKYDNEFIINLLLYYKNKIKISKEMFKIILIKEKEIKSNSIVNFHMIDVEGEKYFVNRYTNELQTPLHVACFYGYLEIIKILIKYGGNTKLANALI
ncbi:hypothetical protein LY90DRAFT_627509 [Neocallimastix californiae]|uniref:Uncharacterized protein n=1 Tax=Neocallimastix californiae TaxID=1754190 RepID=A0A1Y2B4S7_9FUNG|nr:hypothetical protein LY90DRAFT_627509 [Neocallimastix californiae]|eukprot:ORY29833.1 hypothetical protein LY90DRAFT_627509 [Neocallimastix californiae]